MDFVRYITRVYYICIIIVHYYNMKNNYSKRLMDVIEYSREEAARLQNSYIGPEHLMLGIIRDGEGKAVQTLRELNVDELDIKRKIEQEIKNTIDAEDAVQHDIAISKTTERVLRMSMLESRLFKKDETGTEHLLLAILKEEVNVAAKVLNEAGVTYRSIYNYLISGTSLKRMDDFVGEEDAGHFEGISDGYTDDDEDEDEDFSSRREAPRSSSGAGSAQPKSPNDTPVLDNFGTDMTRAAAENRLDPIVGGHPKKLFLMIGVNDLAAGVSPDEIVANVARLIDRFQSESRWTKIYVQSILPVNGESFAKFKNHYEHGRQIVPLNKRLEALCDEKGIVYIDLWTLLADKNGKLRADLTNDGLHLTGEGYVVWRDAIKQHVK